MDDDDLDIMAWAPWAAVLVALLIGLLAFWMAFAMLNEMREVREGEALPTLTLDNDFNTITVRNEGPGIARAVNLTFMYTGPTAIPAVTQGPFNLGVGGSRKLSAGYFPDLIGEYYVTVKAEYKNIYGQLFNENLGRFPLFVGVTEP